MRRFAAALILLCLPVTARAEAVRVQYAAYSTGLNVLRLDAEFAISPRDYRVHLVYRTSGAVGVLIRAEQDTFVEGVFVGDRPAPRRFYSFGHLRGRPRVTQIDYPNGRPEVRTLTPPNDEEREPVAASEQAGTIDSLSAMAQLVRQVNASGRCEGRSRTFDGRRLAELSAHTAGQETLEPTGRSSFAGPTLRCDFEGRQLAGFRLDADRTTAQRPRRGSAWFAAAVPGGPMIPVRMRFETDVIGSVTMYLAAPE
jgi:Protein of unknown function (DUF3108)